MQAILPSLIIKKQIPISKNYWQLYLERTSNLRNSISIHSKTTNLHFDKAKPQTLQDRSTRRAIKSNFARGTRLALSLKARSSVLSRAESPLVKKKKKKTNKERKSNAKLDSSLNSSPLSHLPFAIIFHILHRHQRKICISPVTTSTLYDIAPLSLLPPFLPSILILPLFAQGFQLPRSVYTYLCSLSLTFVYIFSFVIS